MLTVEPRHKLGVTIDNEGDVIDNPAAIVFNSAHQPLADIAQAIGTLFKHLSPCALLWRVAGLEFATGESPRSIIDALA